MATRKNSRRSIRKTKKGRKNRSKSVKKVEKKQDIVDFYSIPGMLVSQYGGNNEDNLYESNYVPSDFSIPESEYTENNENTVEMNVNQEDRLQGATEDADQVMEGNIGIGIDNGNDTPDIPDSMTEEINTEDLEDNEEDTETPAPALEQEPEEPVPKPVSVEYKQDASIAVSDPDGIETVEYDHKRLMEIFESTPNTIFEMDIENGLYYNHPVIFPEVAEGSGVEVVINYEFSVYKTTVLNRIPTPYFREDLITSGQESFTLPENMTVQEFLDHLMYSANKTVFPNIGLIPVVSFKVSSMDNGGKKFSELNRDDFVADMPKQLFIDMEYRIRDMI